MAGANVSDPQKDLPRHPVVRMGAARLSYCEATTTTASYANPKPHRGSLRAKDPRGDAMSLVTILFWLLVVCDLAALGLLYALGLAAAGPSHTSPLAVTAYFLVLPGILLLGAIAVFAMSGSTLWRGAAFLVAAAPLLSGLLYVAYAKQQIASYQGEGGEFYHLPRGAARDLESAIARGDAAGVSAAATAATANQVGRDGVTALGLAVRRLEKEPGSLDILRSLLEAGADPNLRGDPGEAPLTIAIRVSGKAGAEPIRLLLDAGADPNALTQFGEPVFFAATGITAPKEAMELLLDHGADLSLRKKDGGNALLQAALTQNWEAALLLLERGADWRRLEGLGDRDLRSLLESSRGFKGDSPALAAVARFLDEAEAAGRP
jgi:hypothetical protein